MILHICKHCGMVYCPKYIKYKSCPICKKPIIEEPSAKLTVVI